MKIIEKIKNLFVRRSKKQRCFEKDSIKKKDNERWLEIGPGNERLPGFEGLNIVKNDATDYIADVAIDGIPLPDESFDLVYSSHFLEHIEWYKVEFVLKEMYRVLKKGGKVEIHVPDGLKIAQQLIFAEKGRINKTPDGWKRRNEENNPFLWVNGRMFYGDNLTYPSWHKGVFTERYLRQLLKKIGFTNIKKLGKPRGYDHGWIDLGISGTKEK